MLRRRQPRDIATRVLVGVNVAIFLLQLLAGASWMPVLEYFALSREGLRHGEIWQLVTYQFLHANEMHIFVNMVGLWFAGRELERVIGTSRYVALYLVGGVVGGLVQVAFTSGPLIGASASVCAVLLAFTTLFPDMQIMALLFFVLPVRMRARTLGIGLVAVSVLFWLSGLEPEVGHLAHLGGFAAGWLFGMFHRAQFGEGGWVPPAFTSRKSAPENRRLRALPTVDEVLAKIQRFGVGSLTREEERILEESRQRRRD